LVGVWSLLHCLREFRKLLSLLGDARGRKSPDTSSRSYPADHAMLRRRAAQVAAAALRAALANPHGGAGVQGGPPAAAVAAARTWQQLRHQSQSQWGGRPRQEYVTFQRRGGGGSRGQRGAGGLTRGQVTLLVGTAAGGTLVWASSRQEVPYTGRKHAVLVDPATERQLGEQTFAQVLAEARAARSLLPATHPATRAVRRVGERIAAVAGDGVGGGFQAQMRGLKWEFAVIQVRRDTRSRPVTRALGQTPTRLLPFAALALLRAAAAPPTRLPPRPTPSPRSPPTATPLSSPAAR
jgi:hypothetical protein